ncbi:MAG: hypothetical protein ACM3X5_09270, partial [Bacillota bacterium]
MIHSVVRALLVFAVFPQLAMAQPGASAPSVDGILDRFEQALGGRAALEKIGTMFFTGVLNVSGMQSPGKMTEYFDHSEHFASIAEIPGYGTVRTVVDGKTAWIADAKKGVSEFSGARLADIRRRADIHWNLKLREFYPDLAVVGRENVGKGDAWRLESNVDGWTYRFFFDTGTGLLVRFDTDTHAPGGNSTVLVGDYRQVGP